MDPAGDAPDADSRLDDLVARCLAAADEAGSTGIAEELAREPELADDARRRLRLLHDAGLVPDPDAPGAPDDGAPRRLGEFEVLERLGGGGMGVVHRARQAGLQRDVALKLVRPDLLGAGNARLRFAREAEAVARLAHPGIVPVHTVGEDDGIPYLAMELVHGATLGAALTALADRAPARLAGADLAAAVSQLARRDDEASTDTGSGSVHRRLFGGSWVESAWRLGIQVAEALCHAHERGVLHRDVKPSNLMITPAGRVLLLDFGLARREGDPRITGPGAELGSLLYTPPEVLRGQGESGDARGDVYSLAVTLFEMLALRAPFEARDHADVRAAILAGDAPRLPDVNPAVGPDGATVLAKAMDPDPARRYGDMSAFLADLQNLLAHRPVEARPAGPWLRARRWSQRHPTRAVALALGGLLALGLPLTWAVVQTRAATRIEGHLAAEAEARRTADAALRAERDARALAEHERGRAERSVGRAREAITVLLAELGSEEFGGSPGVEAGRRRMLDQALGFLEGFLEDHADDPGLARDLVEVSRQLAGAHALRGGAREAADVLAETLAAAAARPALGNDPDALLLLAELRGDLAIQLRELGRFDEARARFAEAFTLLDGAPASDARPTVPTRIRLLLERGRLNLLHGDFDASIADSLEAVELASTRYAERPDDPEALRAVILGLGFLGDGLVRGGHTRDALASFGRALDLARLLHETVGDTDSALVLAARVAAQAKQLYEQGQLERARPLLHEALERTRALSEAAPQVERYADMLAQAHGALANLARRDGDGAAAREHFVASLTILQGFVERHPEVLRLRMATSAEWHNLASLEFELGRWDEALATYERAREEIRAGLEGTTGIALLEDMEWETTWMISRTCLALGDHARAAREAEATLTLGTPTATSVRVAAGLVARCVDLGGGTETDARYRDLGLTWLDRAVAMGFRDVGNLLSADDLASLRDDPRWSAIIDRAQGGS